MTGLNELDDALILGHSGGVQRLKLLKQNRIKSVGVITCSGQPAHPDAIRHQHMIQGAMQTAKIRTDFPVIQCSI